MDVFQTSDDVKIKTALARLQELRVRVEATTDYYRLLVPHNLEVAEYIEFGYLMVQLVDIPFPGDYVSCM